MRQGRKYQENRQQEVQALLSAKTLNKVTGILSKGVHTKLTCCERQQSCHVSREARIEKTISAAPISVSPVLIRVRFGQKFYLRHYVYIPMSTRINRRTPLRRVDLCWTCLSTIYFFKKNFLQKLSSSKTAPAKIDPVANWVFSIIL